MQLYYLYIVLFCFFLSTDTQGDADEVTIVGAVLGTVALIVCVVVGIVVWRRFV